MPHPSSLSILMLSTTAVLTPRTGGDLRVVHLARELAALGHSVDVVGWVVGNHPRGRRAEGPRLTFEQRHSIWLNLAAVADRLRLAPITELPVWLRGLRGAIGRLTRRRRYHIVHFEHPWFAYLYDAVAGGARAVYGAQNVEIEWWRPRLARYPFGARFARRLEAHERAAIGRAAGVVTCSDADAAWMRERRGVAAGRVCVAPNGFDASRIKPPDAESRRRLREAFGFRPDETIALFVGSRAHPNVEAVRAILDRVAPATAGRAVRHVIVGRVGERFAGTAAPGVTFVGQVDDTLPWMQAADVGVNPMTSGSGTNIKLVEYCAAGLPVVTTEFGLRGYEALGEWLAVCEIGEFARAIPSARWPVKVPPETLEQFSWSHAARALAEFHARLAGGG